MKEKIWENKYPEVKYKHLNWSVDVLKVLIEKMFFEIKNHKFDIVIGDDVSGRLPTLIIGGAMKLIYKEMGVQEPKILFLAGHRSKFLDLSDEFVYFRDEAKSKWHKKLDTYFGYLKSRNIINNKSNILLVTDYIDQGETMSNFLDFFKKRHIRISIAAVQTQDKSSFIDTDVTLYKGGEDYVRAPLFYDNGDKGLRTLAKTKLDGIFSEISPGKIHVENSLKIKDVREDVKTIISILKDHYDKLNK